MAVCGEQTPALATMEGGVRVACHLYPGADVRHPRQRWVPVGRRTTPEEPPLEATLR